MVWIDDIETTNTALNILNNQKWFFWAIWMWLFTPYKFYYSSELCGCAWIEIKEEKTAHQKFINDFKEMK